MEVISSTFFSEPRQQFRVRGLLFLVIIGDREQVSEEVGDPEPVKHPDLGAFPLAYCNGKVIVCPGVMLMCEMFCPPYTSNPVLVKPVTGMTAVGRVAVDGIVMVICGVAEPTPTMLAVTPDWLYEFRFCINTAV